MLTDRQTEQPSLLRRDLIVVSWLGSRVVPVGGQPVSRVQHHLPRGEEQKSNRIGGAYVSSKNPHTTRHCARDVKNVLRRY